MTIRHTGHRHSADGQMSTFTREIHAMQRNLAAGPRHHYSARYYRPPTEAEIAAEAIDPALREHRLEWQDKIDNLVVNEGLDLYLDSLTSAAVALSVGLTDGSPTFAGGDTMSSHAGWSEVTNYGEASRISPTFAAASSQSRDNSANVATYSINATVTVGGAFVATNATKGGTSGTLLGGGPFAEGNKAMDSGGTLDVTITLTQAAAA